MEYVRVEYTYNILQIEARMFFSRKQHERRAPAVLNIPDTAVSATALSFVLLTGTPTSSITWYYMGSCWFMRT